jgi:signal transduction histidine kinase
VNLQRRLSSAAALLVALQVAGTVLGFASWTEVRRAVAAQEVLSERREWVAALERATQAVYVHQAHTLIERGTGHLDHLAAAQGEVDRGLVRVGDGALRAAVVEQNRWFAAEVVPVAGELDQAAAVALHDQAERRARTIEAEISRLAADVERAHASERARIAAATRRAWVAVAVLTLGGAVVAGLVAGRLARSIQAAELRRVQVERLAALGQMSGAVAHELMNPLAVILSDPAMRAPEVAASRAEAEHARRVVEGLLGFARPGEEPAQRVDLAAAAASCAERVLPLADSRDVAVRVEAGAGGTTLASPSAVRQVLDNLVLNAVHASPPGSEVVIALRSESAIEVLDRGTGIPPAVRARLYEPFVTGRADGTGLGLAICQRIARAHGGALVHRDRPGGGTIAEWTLAVTP